MIFLLFFVANLRIMGNSSVVELVATFYSVEKYSGRRNRRRTAAHKEYGPNTSFSASLVYDHHQLIVLCVAPGLYRTFCGWDAIPPSTTTTAAS